MCGSVDETRLGTGMSVAGLSITACLSAISLRLTDAAALAKRP
jgi:hypothetical protein